MLKKENTKKHLFKLSLRENKRVKLFIEIKNQIY